MTAELNIHLTDLETGKVSELTHWSQYSVIDDLMNPAATFNATLAATQFQRELTAAGGQKAQVFCYGALQATAIVDERSEATNQQSTDLQISGRGVGGLLLDSVVDSKNLSMRNRSLKQVAEDITQPWQPDFITSVVTNNAANRYLISGVNPKYSTSTKKKLVFRSSTGSVLTAAQAASSPGSTWSFEAGTPRRTIKGSRKKFGKNSPVYRGISSDSLKQTRIQPEEKVWEVIAKLSKQIACHSFVGADGALVIMRPCYDFDSSAYGNGIVQLWDRKNHKAAGGNVKRSQYDTTIATRNSEIVAWSTGKANKTTMGKALLKHVWSVRDPGPGFWVRTDSGGLGTAKLHKPTRVVFKNLRNEKLIKRRCRGMFEEACIAGFSLEYELNGHTINGVMPVVDSMIAVHDERYGLIGQNYYIARVERKMDMTSGKTTVLKLIPPKIWLYFDHDTTDDVTYESHMIDMVNW